MQSEVVREPFSAQSLNKMPAKVLPTFIFNPLEDQENQPAPLQKVQRPKTPVIKKKPESRPSSRSSCRSTKRPAPTLNTSKVPNFKSEVTKLLELVAAHANPELLNVLKTQSQLWVEYSKLLKKTPK